MTNPTNALSEYPHTDKCKCVLPFIDFQCLGLKEGMTIGFKGHDSEEIFTQTIGSIEQDERTGTITILTDGDEPEPDVTPLSVRMLEAADTLSEISKRYGYLNPEAGTWTARALRIDSQYVEDEEAERD